MINEWLAASGTMEADVRLDVRALQTAPEINPLKGAACSSPARRHAMAAPTDDASCKQAGAGNGMVVGTWMHDLPPFAPYHDGSSSIFTAKASERPPLAA